MLQGLSLVDRVIRDAHLLHVAGQFTTVPYNIHLDYRHLGTFALQLNPSRVEGNVVIGHSISKRFHEFWPRRSIVGWRSGNVGHSHAEIHRRGIVYFEWTPVDGCEVLGF